MKLPFFGRRGQAEAPMELVIAVIILTMSLGLAFYIMNNTAEAQCVSQLKAENEKLRLAMQDISLGYSGTQRKINYKMYSCGRNRVDAIRFVKYVGSQFCGNCPGHYGSCWKIEPAIKTADNVYATLLDAAVCVDMSESIYLQPITGGDCEDMANDPCPPDAGGCRSGVPSNVRNIQGNDWWTLGKTGAGNYEITLKKETAQATGGATGSVGLIRVCAKKLGV